VVFRVRSPHPFAAHQSDALDVRAHAALDVARARLRLAARRSLAFSVERRTVAARDKSINAYSTRCDD
jgi:hypothetical protein